MASEQGPGHRTSLSGVPSYERKVFRLALAGGLPAVVVCIALLIHGHYTGKVQWTLGVLVIATWLIVAAMLRERVVRPLQTLSNLLGAFAKATTRFAPEAPTATTRWAWHFSRRTFWARR